MRQTNALLPSTFCHPVKTMTMVRPRLDAVRALVLMQLTGAGDSTAGLEHELRIVRDELSALHSYVDTLAHRVQATDSTLAELVKARPRSGSKPSLSVDVARARRSPRSSRSSRRTLRVGAGVRSPTTNAGESSVPPSPSEPDTATPTPGQSPTWISSNPPSPAVVRQRDETSLSPPIHRKPQWSPKTPLSATRRAGFVGSAAVVDSPSSPLRADRDRRAQPLYGSPSGFHHHTVAPPTIAIANTPATPASIEAEAVLTPSTGGGLASANVRSFSEAVERPSLSRQGSATSSTRSRSGDTCMQILPAAVKVRLSRVLAFLTSLAEVPAQGVLARIRHARLVAQPAD